MKKLPFINKVILFINNIFAILLLLSYVVPYIKPSSFSIAPIMGLTVPALIFINILFVWYWILIGFKKQFFLSVFVLILGYFIVSPIYKFSSPSNEKGDNEISIMSYNVRKFNMYKWIDDEKIPQKISQFIKKENPDVVALQEFKEDESFSLNYPYSYNPKIGKRNKSGLAIYSKYPIISQERMISRKNDRRIIYIDILKKEDTLRIYNFHLFSLGLVPDEDYLGHKDSDRLLSRLKKAFKLQERQLVGAENQLLGKNNIKTIIAGDLNNTAYSWAYKNLKSDYQDSFLESGKGFGKTYNFKGFPLRIDYIFVDSEMKVSQHKNFDVKYSDHYPIMTTISF